ncbi:GNAT family N-acetyltransferase [Actinoplanes palleronii]|uniref:N-acetyltransferase n=1 Tax=Actinoplanes palleronii TaxID=113570 RepID=A0ABQ4B8H2_9ACTN|nr:GNAT family N-acetyltransferase [Actinoplanes palleronii]GIE66991.1 N-acetyltransferase [Actinoplanes palleronii]
MASTITDITPDQPAFDQLADLFDEYRVHYGETADPGGTAEWLREQLTAGPLRAAAALPDLGFVTTVVLPASLRLATFWQVRDLYVRPDRRRGGTARALLNHVVGQARAAGAIRVSLQTEPDNVPARALYASAGFRPVEGLIGLSLTLSAAAQRV